MSRQTVDGSPLKPGVNVDPVDIAAGLKIARDFGYGDAKAQMVVQYALQRHARGEEKGAQDTWLHEYPRDLTSWYAILAAAVTSGTEALKEEPVPTEAETLLREASAAAEIEYPITEDLTITERSVKLVLREGFVKGFLKARAS